MRQRETERGRERQRKKELETDRERDKKRARDSERERQQDSERHTASDRQKQRERERGGTERERETETETETEKTHTHTHTHTHRDRDRERERPICEGNINCGEFWSMPRGWIGALDYIMDSRGASPEEQTSPLLRPKLPPFPENNGEVSQGVGQLGLKCVERAKHSSQLINYRRGSSFG